MAGCRGGGETHTALSGREFKSPARSSGSRRSDSSMSESREATCSSWVGWRLVTCHTTHATRHTPQATRHTPHTCHNLMPCASALENMCVVAQQKSRVGSSMRSSCLKARVATRPTLQPRRSWLSAYLLLMHHARSYNRKSHLKSREETGEAHFGNCSSNCIAFALNETTRLSRRNNLSDRQQSAQPSTVPSAPIASRVFSAYTES